MKKLYGFLRILLWCFIGVFLGSSLYQYLDYKAHPGAPWYTAIQIRGLFTIVLVVITLAVMAIIRKKMK